VTDNIRDRLFHAVGPATKEVRDGRACWVWLASLAW